MNEEVGERNRYYKSTGKILLVQRNQTMRYVNVFSVFYSHFPMGRKDTHFGRVIP